MEDSGYEYVEDFASWQKVLIQKQNKSAQPYNDICHNIITDTDKSDKYENICIFFTKSMDYIANETDFTDVNPSLKEICAYLNYYLNSEIKNVNDSSIKPEEFYSKIKAKDASKFINFTKCDSKIKNIKDNLLDEMEYIHNLFFNYNEYLINFTMENSVKCPFVQKCHTSYNERIKECHNSSSYIFCKKMLIFKGEYDKYMNNNQCSVPYVWPPFGEEHTHKIQSEEERDATPRVDSPSMLPPEIVTHTLTTSGIVLGLSVLYKFTPIGTRISQLFQRKNNIVQNIQEQNDDNSLFNSDNLHRSSSNSNYNITYQQY